MALSSHTKRVITAAAALPLVGFAVATRGPAEFALMSIVVALGLSEFYKLFYRKPGDFKYSIIGIALGLCVLASSKTHHPGFLMGFLILAFWLGNLDFLGRYGELLKAGSADEASSPPDGEDTADEIATRDFEKSFYKGLVMAAGLLYIPTSLQFFFHFEKIEIVLVMAAIIASDTGAYYAGSIIGGKKIWPQISPKKTVAGSLGGMASAFAVCMFIGGLDEYYLGGAGQGRPWWMWLMLGISLNIASQLGDFFESALKRRLKVKDSGSILPGHGGVLDRIDSLLLAVPTYAGMDAFFHFFR